MLLKSWQGSHGLSASSTVTVTTTVHLAAAAVVVCILRAVVIVVLQMCVVGNMLWLFGGIVELGEKEITLDDLWSLNLAKMDGWSLLQGNTAGEELFAADAAVSSSDDESMSEEDT
jgi:Galactose oxidase, central domain